MPNKNFASNIKESGQTLIETLVAIFILVMGIVAILGLAVYSLNSSSNVIKQIVAVGLAREGVEAVRNMRDTNWMQLYNDLDNDCYDYATASNSANCYKEWLDKGGTWNNSGNDRGFRIDPGGSTATYRLEIAEDASDKAWILSQANNNWGLNLSTSVSNASFSGFYTPNSGQAHGSSDYYRKIALIKSTASPYRSDLERLQVIVQVWWTDRRCPRSADWPGIGKCSVELQTYLTNWKNY